MSASEGLRRDLRCAVDKTHRLLSNMTIRCNRCTRKRFRWYNTHQQTVFVPPKTFLRYKMGNKTHLVPFKTFSPCKMQNLILFVHLKTFFWYHLQQNRLTMFSWMPAVCAHSLRCCAIRSLGNSRRPATRQYPKSILGGGTQDANYAVPERTSPTS